MTSNRDRRWSGAVAALLVLLGLGACRPESEAGRGGESTAASAASSEGAPAVPGAGGSGHDPEMRLIPGGRFVRGADAAVEVSSFWMDRTEVTVEAFSRFVEATGFVTEAETWGWSLVFQPEPGEHPEEEQRVPGTPWWLRVDGATWRNPHARGEVAESDHPVVHVSWNDAQAFCSWRGARLPTEAEWEFASLGGLESSTYPWGDELVPDGHWQANVWQGEFPYADHRDGHAGLAPVASYEPNAYGLFDLGGNVWEWCSDWFAPGYHAHAPVENPQGPEAGVAKVLRGGSWLCSESYCRGYRRDTRNSSAPDSGLDNTGFRCVRDA